MEVSELVEIYGVMFVLSLRNSAGSFLGRTLGVRKLFVEGIIFVWEIGDTYRSPLGIYVG